MMTKLSVLIMLLAGVESISEELQHKANPIRRVVTMLQMMQNKVVFEGQKKKEIYDKFMCYCDNADTLLGGAITAAENKLPLLEAQLKADAATKAQLDADVASHNQGRIDAKEAISKATAQRAKDHEGFLKEEGDLKSYVQGLSDAITMIAAGATGFLQTNTGKVLRDLSISYDMSSVDRQMLTSFLTGRISLRGRSDEISGILNGMLDDMKKSLNEVVQAEADSVSEFEALVAAKEKEIEALGASIESKSIRSGEMAVKHAEGLTDFEDTKEDMAESKQFLLDLDDNCEKKKKEWSAYQKLQGEENLALADTIKMLNDDDALELFKKTLPGKTSFLQFKVSANAIRRRALDILKQRSTTNPQIDFLETALRGGKVGFEKIIALIDKLSKGLEEDQRTDDDKKAYCEEEFDKTEDTKKALQNTASDLQTAIDDASESIMNLKVEIETLDDGIRALDKEVAQATENRQDEHQEFVSSSAANKATIDILKMAKNRMNKFYNPSQYEPPAKRQLGENEQIQSNMGYSFMQLSTRRGDAAPPPPPAANLAYATKGEESSGVIQMLDNIINDVDSDVRSSELEEKDAQQDYEKFMEDAANKRSEDSKAITDKQASLGDTEEELVTTKESLGNTNNKLMETEKYLGGLHAECDWLIKYFDTRKEARTGELEALDKAKAVLNGADYSF